MSKREMCPRMAANGTVNRLRLHEHQLPAACDLVVDLALFTFGEGVLNRIGGKRIDARRKALPEATRLGRIAANASFFVEWNDTHLRFTHLLFLLTGICCGSHMKSRRKQRLCHKGGIGVSPGDLFGIETCHESPQSGQSHAFRILRLDVGCRSPGGGNARQIRRGDKSFISVIELTASAQCFAHGSHARVHYYQQHLLISDR
jgi:hypothetical protein